MKDDKIYFPGLNGIRAIAASIVVVFHIDNSLSYFGVKKIGFSVLDMQAYAVVLFFVLSGYLITYLLLAEKEKYLKVDIKKFYIRRILRIWPVFYVVIFIGLVFCLIDPAFRHNGGFSLKLFLLYSFFFGDVALAVGLYNVIITSLWSVAIEEKFYAIWPWLINKTKNVSGLLFFVIVVCLALKIIFRYAKNDTYYNIVSTLCTIDCMAFGGVAAYMVYSKNKIIRFLYTPLVQVCCWAFLGISIFYKPVHIASLFDREIHSLVYAVIILNVSTNKKTLLRLEGKALNFLGRISYGIYAYHMVVIYTASLILKSVLKGINSWVMQNIIVFSFCMAGTVFVSFLSFKYFESWFLGIKTRFSLFETDREKVS